MTSKGRRTRIFLDNVDTVVNAAFAESEKLKDEKRYEGLKTTLLMYLEQKMPGHRVKMHFFGSRPAGLADDKSDMDIYLEFGKILTFLEVSQPSIIDSQQTTVIATTKT
jgi:hypothetical protein